MHHSISDISVSKNMCTPKQAFNKTSLELLIRSNITGMYNHIGCKSLKNVEFRMKRMFCLYSTPPPKKKMELSGIASDYTLRGPGFEPYWGVWSCP